MVKIKFTEGFFTAVFIAIAILIMSACSSYQFGDVSKAYCYSTSNEFRLNIKATLEDNGVNIGVNYCASVGLIDALIVRENEKQWN
ncbi:MAG: hypothetical protein COB83_08005 [Gammaproteobacteria bacterium]|nr:MAG: hypothetical protein COB83_08005 [Gammaproteobacteria bacterium]